VPLIGAPLAYTPGTNGPVSGEPMIVAITRKRTSRSTRDAEGKMVLLGPGATCR
jgi:hypothetical protein